MPFADYQCPKCQEIVEIFTRTIGKWPVVKCKKCKCQTKKMMFQGVLGMNKNAEPWEYEYVRKVKPKIVKDHDGHRQKYNPNTHIPGRKGSGR